MDETPLFINIPKTKMIVKIGTKGFNKKHMEKKGFM